MEEKTGQEKLGKYKTPEGKASRKGGRKKRLKKDRGPLKGKNLSSFSAGKAKTAGKFRKELWQKKGEPESKQTWQDR